MIDGIPERTLVPNLINREKLPPFEISARYIPVPTPIGIDIIEAIVDIIIVPNIAGPIPPADVMSPPGGSGSKISTLKFIYEPPLITT